MFGTKQGRSLVLEYYRTKQEVLHLSLQRERESAQGCERNADVTSLLSTPVTVYLPSTSQAKACKSLLGFPYSKLASGCHRGLT